MPLDAATLDTSARLSPSANRKTGAVTSAAASTRRTMSRVNRAGAGIGRLHGVSLPPSLEARR